MRIVAVPLLHNQGNLDLNALPCFTLTVQFGLTKKKAVSLNTLFARYLCTTVQFGTGRLVRTLQCLFFCPHLFTRPTIFQLSVIGLPWFCGVKEFLLKQKREQSWPVAVVGGTEHQEPPVSLPFSLRFCAVISNTGSSGWKLRINCQTWEKLTIYHLRKK